MPVFATRADAGEAKAGDQASREEFAPVDGSLLQLPACCLCRTIFLFLSYAHLISSLRLTGSSSW